jgi:hypothetical protein
MQELEQTYARIGIFRGDVNRNSLPRFLNWGSPSMKFPISYRERTYQAGMKIGCKDGVSAIRCILKYRFQNNE